MLLVTSAFPHLRRFDENGVDVGADLVARCVRSWQSNGFRVLSVHNESDREQIGLGLPGVRYAFVDERIPGSARSMPSLAAVIAQAPSDEPIGIINADIFMVPFEGLAERMEAFARSRTIVMHRYDVPSIDRRDGKIFEIGVDLLAFTPSLIAPAIDGLVRRPFQLGVPWWDYALPLAASLYAPLALATDPILLHHAHQLNWNENEWHRFAALTEDYLLEQANNSSADPQIADVLKRRMGQLHEDFASDQDRYRRNYALDEIARHMLHRISGHRALNLFAEMSLRGDQSGQAAAWDSLSSGEMARLEAAERAKGAAESIAAEVVSAAAAQEPPQRSPVMLTPEVVDSAPLNRVLAAGLHDASTSIMTVGKAIERRFRRWRRR